MKLNNNGGRLLDLLRLWNAYVAGGMTHAEALQGEAGGDDAKDLQACYHGLFELDSAVQMDEHVAEGTIQLSLSTSPSHLDDVVPPLNMRATSIPPYS